MLEHLFFMLFALGTFAIGVYVIRNNVKFFNMFKISQKNNYRPSVSVIAPVRDTDEKFEENILSLLKQKYKGKWEVLFVVDEDDRKTRDSVNKIIKKYKNARLVKNIILPTCSGKSSAMICGYDNAKYEVIAGYDSDVKIPESWLTSLVNPLKNERTGGTTGYRFYAPFGSYVLSAWNAIGFISMRKHVFTWGGSFAIKKALAEKLHVREKWKHSISDDVVITNSLKEAKLQNMFVPGCVGISYPSKFSHITEFTTRQVTIVRWHWIEAFIAGFILYFVTRISILFGVVALYIYAVTGNALYGIESALFLSFILLELIRANIDFNNFSCHVCKIPSRLKWNVAYLAAQWLMAYNILAAMNKKTIMWRGRKYDFSREIKHV